LAAKPEWEINCLSYRTDLTERLIEIIFLLARRPHSRQELAQIFEVNAKTISKDVDALTREYPIEQEKRGREVFYRFQNNYSYQIPVFTPEEIAALLLAQESIAHVGITAQGSPFSESARSLLEKIRTVLPASVQDRIDALAAVYGSSAIPAKNFARHAAAIDRLAAAAVNRKRVLIKYHGLNRNEEERRTLEPYAVYFDPDGATLKLIGKDLNRQEIRVFSIDRIGKVETLAENFKRPPDFDLRRYLEENCFNGIHGAPVTVRLKAKGITARIFAERRFHPTQQIVERKQRRGAREETVTIEMRVAAGRGLERFILGWLPDIEVVSPASLRESIRQTIEKSLKSF
jgi:predicted DNA-binding transcriptional regulator YafY